jgi:hypothetical protein
VGPMMDYTNLTLPELTQAISETKEAISRCKKDLNELGRQPKSEALVEAKRGMLAKLQKDLEALDKEAAKHVR